MKFWQPYKLGVLLTEFVKPICQLCHYQPSKYIPVKASSHYQQSWSSNHSLLASKLNSGILCESCHNDICWLPNPKKIEVNLNNQQNRAICIQAASYYQYPINHVIRRYKFLEDMRMLLLLIHAIRQIPKPIDCHSHNSVILPVPTTVDRLKQRGFNPLFILTEYLSNHWNIPIWQGVARIDDTVSQRQLSKEERQENIKGAFIVTNKIPVDKVLIFDDVATTGSTIKELATVLQLSSKSLKIRAYCIAHGAR